MHQQNTRNFSDEYALFSEALGYKLIEQFHCPHNQLACQMNKNEKNED